MKKTEIKCKIGNIGDSMKKKKKGRREEIKMKKKMERKEGDN